MGPILHKNAAAHSRVSQRSPSPFMSKLLFLLFLLVNEASSFHTSLPASVSTTTSTFTSSDRSNGVQLQFVSNGLAQAQRTDGNLPITGPQHQQQQQQQLMQMKQKRRCRATSCLSHSHRRRWYQSNKGRAHETNEVDRTITPNSFRQQQRQQQQQCQNQRRSFLMASTAGLFTSFFMATSTTSWLAKAEPSFFSRRRLSKPRFVTENPRQEVLEELRTEQVDVPVPTLSSEYALLRTLPVKNPVFRGLEQQIESLSILRVEDFEQRDEASRNATWTKTQKSVSSALKLLDNKRTQLQPAFDPEQSTILTITKAERCEVMIENLRDEIIQLIIATNVFNKTLALEKQQDALLALGYIGELLVKEFPYKVPSRGTFAYLPRLLGRAKVVFRIKRGNNILGDITIIADGYTAPISAGCFIDLCVRNFYTGLPVKDERKRFGPTSEYVPGTVNVLGSYKEGFYDPLTAKLRTIPLEIIRLEKGSPPKLTYAATGLSESSTTDMSAQESFIPYVTSKPLLTFDTPGLVAFNHPDRKANGASAEFFGLSPESMEADSRYLLDGEYAPFGYIVRGYDIFNSLQPGDVIESTTVDGFGLMNLVKLKKSSFGEVVQGTEAASKMTSSSSLI